MQPVDLPAEGKRRLLVAEAAQLAVAVTVTVTASFIRRR
jgi:hypothetical protein